MRFTRAPNLPPLLLELKKSRYYEISGTVLGGYLILLITTSSSFLEREIRTASFQYFKTLKKLMVFMKKLVKTDSFQRTTGSFVGEYLIP
jgi:hypothetical protein